MTKNDTDRVVKSDLTLLQIIHGLQELDGAGVTELADHIEKSKSTVHRHLSSLHDSQYVVKEKGTYRLGLRFLDLGGYVRNHNPVYEQIFPKVRELAEETEEAVQFVAEEHGLGVFIYRETGSKAASTEARIGARIYLHRAAAGKAILANLSEERVEGIIDRWGMPQKTDNTITDREALQSELVDIRDTGFAFDRGEHIPGLHAIGTAVIGPGGEVIGAISISGPAHRLDGELFEEELPYQLLGSVNELELNIAYS